MKLRRLGTAGKFLLKLVHALWAVALAWVCFSGAQGISGDSSFRYNAAGAGVCSVWFVVATCLFFKNRWTWYPGAATIVKTLLKALNVALAAFILVSLLWAFCSSPRASFHEVREDPWQNLLGLLALFVWFVCGIGLFFKKRWAWWGSVTLILASPVGFALGFVLVVVYAGTAPAMVLFIIPVTMFLCFLLATRTDYLSQAMPPNEQTSNPKNT